MISRDWRCMNDACGNMFHTYDDIPECPKCGCVRCDWIPGGGHIMGTAPRMDKRLRTLADDFGLTNLNSPSPSRLNRAKPPLEHRKVDYDGRPMHFAPGFSSPISSQGATCQPTSTPVNLRGKVSIGGLSQGRGGGLINNPSKFVRSDTIAGPGINTRVIAGTRGR